MPKKFDMKVTTIEEAQYLSILKVDELIGSLQTFEVSINGRPENKNKDVAFLYKITEIEDHDGRNIEKKAFHMIYHILEEKSTIP